MKWYGLFLKEECKHCGYEYSEISIESDTVLIYGKETRPCIKCRTPVLQGLSPICKRKYELHQEVLYFEAQLFILTHEGKKITKINSIEYVTYMKKLVTARKDNLNAIRKYRKHPKLYSIEP